MFEEKQNEQMPPPGRARALLIIGGIGLIAVLAFILLASQALRPPQSAVPGLEDAVRAGAPEFDAYRENLSFDDKEIIVHPNMIGMAQYEVRAKLTNRGERAVSGIELLGRMIGFDDKVIAQSTSVPIPRLRREPLAPGESMRISVKVDAPANVAESQVKDVAVDLQGLRFQ